MNPYLDFVSKVPHLSTLGRLYALHLALNASDEGWVTTRLYDEMRWCDCTEAQLQSVLFELEREEIARAYVQPCPMGENQEVIWRLYLPHQPFDHRPQVASNRRSRVLAKTGHRCFYCGADEDDLHLDHMHPSSRGGSDDDDNMIGACGPCNIQKNNRTVEEYRAFLAHRRKASCVADVVFFGEVADA